MFGPIGPIDEDFRRIVEESTVLSPDRSRFGVGRDGDGEQVFALIFDNSEDEDEPAVTIMLLPEAVDHLLQDLSLLRRVSATGIGMSDN